MRRGNESKPALNHAGLTGPAVHLLSPQSMKLINRRRVGNKGNPGTAPVQSERKANNPFYERKNHVTDQTLTGNGTTTIDSIDPIGIGPRR
jgi:hypothetical protein